MTILQILQYPDLRLRRLGYRVGNVNSPKIQKVIQDMLNTLEHTEWCGGLAATQLDIDEPPNIIVINYPNTKHQDSTLCFPNTKYKDSALCLVNLEILTRETPSVEEEGCMSIAVRVKIKRANKVSVRALNQQGETIEFTATGYYARCLQHEHDHLCGALNIDYLEKNKRLNIEKQLKLQNK